MTSSFDTLSNVRTYTGSRHIQIANGSWLPIHAIEDVNSTVRDAFVSPQLPLVLFPSSNWLIITVMFIFVVMVVLCRIRCRAR